MLEAWTIVRRHRANGSAEATVKLLSRSLRSAWFHARLNAEVARAVAQSEAKADALAARTGANLRAEIESMENTDYLGHEGRLRLSDLRQAHRIASDREAADYAAKRESIASAKGRFCSVTFTKKDGRSRRMLVQPATLQHRIKGESASPSARQAAATRAERHPHLLPVWDAENDAIRSVNLATVQRITLDGMTHCFSAN